MRNLASRRREIKHPRSQPVSQTCNIICLFAIIACSASITSTLFMHVRSSNSHKRMLKMLKIHNLCINCHKSGYYVRECQSLHTCIKCNIPHHTTPCFLWMLGPMTLWMIKATFQFFLKPHLLFLLLLKLQWKFKDLLCYCGISQCYINESTCSLGQCFIQYHVSDNLLKVWNFLVLAKTPKFWVVAGLSCKAAVQPVTKFVVSMAHDNHLLPTKIKVTAIIAPRDLELTTSSCQIGCYLESPRPPSTYEPRFFLTPSNIDLFLGETTFSKVLMQGQQTGPWGLHTALKTSFGWVLAGDIESEAIVHHIITHHTSVLSSGGVL